VELNPPLTRVRATLHRLIPSRFPPEGFLKVVAGPEDCDLVAELEGWTNDRLSTAAGILGRVAAEEWVTDLSEASVIMAAFCHPRLGGGRFTDAERGAWYAAFTLEAAHAQCVYHRTVELGEVGVFETRVQMRQYLADLNAEFHDVTGEDPAFAALHDPDSYGAAQAFGRELFAAGSNGIIYRSVRDPGSRCLACFRPALVQCVRQAAHFEYRWEGRRDPVIRELRRSAPEMRASAIAALHGYQRFKKLDDG
jgi:RES domain